MGEQADGRNGTSSADGPAAVSTDGVGTTVGDVTPTARSVDARARSSVDRIRLGVRTALNLLALVAEVIAFACVVVLLARIGLAFMAANPQNVIVRWVEGLADVVVLAFRDLFLPAEPRVRLAVNYGVAAFFWLVVGLVAARLLRGLARLAAGRIG